MQRSSNIFVNEKKGDVCGGNTFYLLKRVRESGFDKIVKQFIENDKLYVRVSAGSILACPNIDIASPFDENDVGLTDLTGLNLTDVVIAPHFQRKEEAVVQNFLRQHNVQVVRLTDDQALFVSDKGTEIIE